MRLTHGFSILLLLTSAAWAQTASSGNAVAPATSSTNVQQPAPAVQQPGATSGGKVVAPTSKTPGATGSARVPMRKRRAARAKAKPAVNQPVTGAAPKAAAAAASAPKAGSSQLARKTAAAPAPATPAASATTKAPAGRASAATAARKAGAPTGSTAKTAGNAKGAQRASLTKIPAPKPGLNAASSAVPKATGKRTAKRRARAAARKGAAANPTLKPAKAIVPRQQKPAQLATEKGAAESKPEIEQPSRPSMNFANKRDPFISPIVRTSAGPGVGCGTGKRCLIADQVVLKGVVRAPSGMIAVVENAARRAYFLRENDPVFNGVVMRITGDSIIFRETVTDRLGKQSIRDIVKKVNTGSAV